jgi:phosphatidylethanolamine/phosphatidyl-N-methylethanolamine N-methyltransferase
MASFSDILNRQVGFLRRNCSCLAYHHLDVSCFRHNLDALRRFFSLGHLADAVPDEEDNRMFEPNRLRDTRNDAVPQNERRRSAPRETDMRGVYARWANVYDLVYAQLLKPGQKAAIAAAMKAGPDVLEVGVGTGLSLDHYPASARVTGVDLSPDMLKKAEARVRRKGLTHVRHLQVMDATALDFADASFDAVIAPYVLTLVPEPEKALDEFARVTRPGGRIVIVSHIGANDGFVADVEAKVAPIAKKIGWSADFKLSRISDWAERTGLAAIAETRAMPPAGFFKVVDLARSGAPAPHRPALPAPANGPSAS